MFRLKQDRIYILGSIVILSSVLSTNSGIAASKPTPKPAPAPAPSPKPAPAPAPSPKPAPSPAPSPKPAPSPTLNPSPETVQQVLKVIDGPAPLPSPNPGLAPTPVAAPPAPLESPKSLESQSGIAKTVLDNPVAEVISVMIANRATLTPTIIQGPVSVIENIGGLAQVVPTLVTVAKSSGPTVAAILATLARGAAYG